MQTSQPSVRDQREIAVGAAAATAPDPMRGDHLLAHVASAGDDGGGAGSSQPASMDECAIAAGGDSHDLMWVDRVESGGGDADDTTEGYVSRMSVVWCPDGFEISMTSHEKRTEADVLREEKMVRGIAQLFSGVMLQMTSTGSARVAVPMPGEAVWQ